MVTANKQSCVHNWVFYGQEKFDPHWLKFYCSKCLTIKFINEHEEKVR